METFGTTKQTVIKKELQYALNHSFIASANTVRGQVVKFNGATEQIEPIAATTDKPFGVVTAGAKKGDKVTVQTPYGVIMYNTADGAITAGAELSVSGTDENLANTVKASAASDQVFGIALTDAADGEKVLVGVIILPYTKA